MSLDLVPLLEPLRRIALRAGEEILRIYGTDFAVEQKGDSSPLTAADTRAHEVICEGLARLTPAIPVWSEESADVPAARRASWSEFWLVDPLDGTKEFVRRNGEFTVNIALIRANAPVLGVVLAPVRDEDYHGAAGAGAWARRGREAPRPLQVAERAANPLRVAGSRSHADPGVTAFLARVGPHRLVSLGSSLKFCLVAAGEADVYPRLGPTCEWDTAAGQAVVECAGGRVTDLAGAPLRYNTRPGTVNPAFVAYGDTSRDWAALLAGVGTGQDSAQDSG
jgi:3'(2'), 5'-bisphosphate nucleotidase